MGVSSETFFLTDYVSILSTALLHGGVSISTQCEINNWHNHNYDKSILGSKRATARKTKFHFRN